MDSECFRPARLIIVEDEPLIRQGIKEFLEWERLGVVIAGDVSDADEAMELVRADPPDLLITDIRMPGADGLVLIEAVKKILPDCIFVILSGYDDFDYARQAISLGVSHYILKPLKEEQFSRIIGECVHKYRRLLSVKEEEKRLKDEWDAAVPALRDDSVRNILHGAVDPDPARLAELEIDLDNEVFIVAGMRLSGKKQKPSVRRELFILKEKVRESVYEYCLSESIEAKSYVLTDNDTIKCILSFPPGCDPEEAMKAVSEKVRQKIGDLYEEELLFGIGSPRRGWDGIPLSAAEAEKVLEYKVLQCNSRVLFFKDINEMQLVKPALLTAAERKKLLAAVSQNDCESIHHVFLRIRADLSQMRLIPPGYLNFMLLDLILSAVRHLYEDGFQAEQVFDMQIFSYDFMTMFESLDELTVWAENFIISLAVRFSEYKSNKPRKVLEDIQRYISENIDQEISLNSVSQKFYYNASYISRIFKEELNYNFLNFVVRQKMEYAARLLRETNMRYGDVCEKVGYHDYKHFATVFKGTMGMTPSEYKKRGCTAYEF